MQSQSINQQIKQQVTIKVNKHSAIMLRLTNIMLPVVSEQIKESWEFILLTTLT